MGRAYIIRNTLQIVVVYGSMNLDTKDFLKNEVKWLIKKNEFYTTFSGPLGHFII